MMPPKTTAGPVCLWLSTLLLGVGSCFFFVGTSERLSYVNHVRCMVRDHTQIRSGDVWRVVQVFPCGAYIDLNHRDSRI
jgi:hypothetical protein